MSRSTGPLTYASFGRRLAAHLLELVWVFPLSLGLLMVGSLLAGGTLSAGSDWFIQFIVAVLILHFWVTRQATPGKGWLGLRIVDAGHGGHAPFPRLVLRYCGYVLSALPLGLGFLWILWDPRRQAWHDKLANTVVVREPDDPGAEARFG